MAKIDEPETTTTITIYKSTHKRLGDYGRKNETFDQILNRLLDIAAQKTKTNRKEVMRHATS